MDLNSDTAKVIAEAAHAAWNAGSIERVLENYADDLIYTTNTGGPNGEPLTIVGKEAFRNRFVPVLLAVESKTTIEGFHYQDGIARVRLSAVVRHRSSGHVLTGSFRQLMHFKAFKIHRLQEIHDALKLAAFWRLVESETAALPRIRSVAPGER